MVILPSLYPFLPAFLSLLRVEGVAFSIDSIGICGVAAGSLRLALIALVLLGFTGFYRVLPNCFTQYELGFSYFRDFHRVLSDLHGPIT